MTPVVLILTHPADVHADAVQAHLDASGVEVRRIDMAGLGFKPYQLAVAGRCGLSVPETLISTVRPVASAMADRLHGGVVVKPMSRFVAGLVNEDDRSGWERAMHLTQQRITTRRHVRLTVVDGSMFAALI